MLLMFVSAAAGSAVTLAPLLHLLYYFSHGGQYHADMKLKVATIAAYVAALALSISSVLLAKS